MKKKLIATLCLVVSLSMLLCSCGADNSSSDKDNNKTQATTAPTVIIQGDSQSISPTNNNDADVTEPTEDEIVEPTEAPTEAPTQAPTQAPAQTQAAHKHSYTAKVTKAATCTAEGVKTYTCSCGDKYTETIKATGHNWGNWEYITLATPSAKGTEQNTCTVCKATTTRDVAPEGAYQWNADYKAGEADKLTFQPRFVFLDNGCLYIDFAIVNETGFVCTTTGIERLTISYTDPTTQKTVVVTELQNLSFSDPITLQTGRVRFDLYVRVDNINASNINMNVDWSYDCKLDAYKN